MRTSAWPIVSWRRLAPMTATLRALKNAPIEAASARCSRACITPTAVSVGSMANSSCITPSSKPPSTLVARLAEHLDHPLVVRQHLGDEPVDAALAPGLGEVLEQQLADAAALVGVLDQERDLGLVALVDRVVAADRDDLARPAVSTNATRSW